METVTYSLLYREDFDIGAATKDVRLADGGLYTLNQLQLSSFLVPKTYRVTPSASAAVHTLSAVLLAGMRLAGVTSEILTGFGTTQGLTGFGIGDGTLYDRWGIQTTLTATAQTDQGDFRDAGWPVYASASDLLVTAEGGTFDGTGRLELTLWYFYLTHRSV